MKCPYCGSPMGLEDKYCPYCGRPNLMAVQHQSEMDYYQEEFERTQDEVFKKTEGLRRHGSWLAVLAVTLVLLMVSIVLNVKAWDIGYELRTKRVKAQTDENNAIIKEYLEAGEYGQFEGFYDANSLDIDYTNREYSAVYWAAKRYVRIISYISGIHDNYNYSFREDYITETCEYIADDLIYLFNIEKEFNYSADECLTEDKMVFIKDIQNRAGIMAKTYFGLTDEDVADIPNMSKIKLGSLIEKRVRP